MATAFESAFQTGVRDTELRRARREALEDEERQTKVSGWYSQANALSKTIALLKPDDPKRKDMMGQLADLEANIKDAYHPIKAPGALQRDWHWLVGHVHKNPPPGAAWAKTTQAGTPDQPITLPDQGTITFPAAKPVTVVRAPASGIGPAQSFTATAQPSTIRPEQSVTLGATPAEETLTLKPTALTKEQRERMARRDQATTQAELDVAAAQPSNTYVEYRDQLIAAGFTPEQAQKALEIYTGLAAVPKDKAGHTSDFQIGFDRYLRGKGIDPDDATAEDEAAYRALVHPHAQSMYQSQRTAFATSLGKAPAALTWQEEQQFLTQRYGASQPYAQKRLALAEDRERIEQANLDLRRSENNFKDYLEIQKSLAPSEKVSTAASRADEFVADPSGPGDIALTFAFIEAVKPSSGFRFTEAERQWITGSRGLIDAAQARINQGYEGTVLSPDQREHMATIIKNAATQAEEQRNRILTGAGQLNPTAAAVAGGGTAPAADTTPTPRTPGALKKKAKANVDSGESDDDFLKKVK
jgi:hypothetical protein